MVFLDYSLDPLGVAKTGMRDLKSATREDLDYYLFCGSVLFRINEVTFDAAWDWVPVLDFATQLFTILRDIKPGQNKALEFTESEASITFRQLQADVQVSANYAHAETTVSYEEIAREASIFFRRVINDLVSLWPELIENKFFLERIAMLSGGA